MTADSSLLTTTSAIRDILKKNNNAHKCGITGREALLMSEPEEDMACSDRDCCQDRKKSREESK